MQQVLIDKAEHPQRKRIAQHIMHFFVYFAQQNVHFWYFLHGSMCIFNKTTLFWGVHGLHGSSRIP